jgi:hypothetical protein
MNDEEVTERLKKTVAVVQATHTERLHLWMEWSSQSGWDDIKHIERGGTPHRKYRWEQMNPGCWMQIGKIKGMPVCLELQWVLIEGQVVLFWEMTSQVVDYRMGEKWLEDSLKPWPTYDNGSRRSNHDAMNFHNAMSAILQAAGIER